MSTSSSETDKRQRFADEAKAFSFRFRCHDCVHVVPSTRACTLGCPNTELRDNPSAFAGEGDERWAFCKYFEVG